MMDPGNTPSSLLVPLSLLSACFAAACASPARQSEAATPTAIEASADDGAKDPAARASSERAAGEPGDAENSEVHAAPEESAASDAMQAAPEEEKDLDKGNSSSAPGVPKSPSPLSERMREKKKVDLLSELKLQILDFDESLQPETQSCDGARPLKDAICSIAGRICEMESPSTVKSADCSQAQESCEKAKKNYKAKCS